MLLCLIAIIFYGGVQYINGDLTISGDLKYNFRHLVYAKDSATVYSTASVNKFIFTKMLPGLSKTEADGITYAGDSITIITAGDYMIEYYSNFVGDLNDNYIIQCYKNGVKEGQGGRYVGSGTRSSEWQWFWYFVGLAAGDDISFYVANQTSNAKPLKFYETKIYIEKKPE